MVIERWTLICFVLPCMDSCLVCIFCRCHDCKVNSYIIFSWHLSESLRLMMCVWSSGRFFGCLSTYGSLFDLPCPFLHSRKRWSCNLGLYAQIYRWWTWSSLGVFVLSWIQLQNLKIYQYHVESTGLSSNLSLVVFGHVCLWLCCGKSCLHYLTWLTGLRFTHCLLPLLKQKNDKISMIKQEVIATFVSVLFESVSKSLVFTFNAYINRCADWPGIILCIRLSFFKLQLYVS